MINKVFKSIKEIEEWETTSLHTFQPSRYEKENKRTLAYKSTARKETRTTYLLYTVQKRRCRRAKEFAGIVEPTLVSTALHT